MKETAFPSFGDIAVLVENIPIVNANIQTTSINKLDAKFGLGREEDYKILQKFDMDTESISTRDIIKLFNRFLKEERRMEEVYNQIFQNRHEVNVGYPIEYLLFDYCLAALGNDETDALLYASHSFRILQYDKSFYMMLNVIVKDKLTHDADVKKFLALLASLCKPLSAESHRKSFGEDYHQRFELYTTEIKKALS